MIGFRTAASSNDLNAKVKQFRRFGSQELWSFGIDNASFSRNRQTCVALDGNGNTRVETEFFRDFDHGGRALSAIGADNVRSRFLKCSGGILD